MVKRTITEEDLTYINYFETLFGSEVLSFHKDPERNLIVYVLKPGEARRIVLFRKKLLDKLKRLLKKNVLLLEYNPDLEQFILNIFFQIKVKKVSIENGKNGYRITVYVDPLQKGKAIGRDARNIKLAKEILSAYHNIESLVIV